jgi:uncharacterized protein YcbX
MTIIVRRLSLTAVKATRVQDVEAITLGPHGARGDRPFYVIDADGAMINGKRLGELQTVEAGYDADDATLALVFADGARAAGRVRLGPEIATTFFGHPRRARVLDGPWSHALSEQLGVPLRIVAVDSAVDRGPGGAVSVVSRGSLERLAQASDDETAVDARRFRMLIEVDGVPAHEEDRWVGRELEVGPARLRMHGNIGRCVTTTRSPDSGVVDLPTLKMLASYRLDQDTTEPLAFGIHGEVLAGGTVRLGDELTVGDTSFGAQAGSRDRVG